MGRTTRTITISLPPEMAAQVEEIMREEGRTKSELLREALRRYIEEREWKRLLKYAQAKAKEAGTTTEEQVNDLIHARRAQKETMKKQDIWVGYDPEKVKEALRKSAGALRDIDGEALKRDIDQARGQDTYGRPGR